MKQSTMISRISTVILSLFAAMSLCMTFKNPVTATMPPIAELFTNLKNSLRHTSALSTVVFVVLLFIHQHFQLEKEKTIGVRLAAVCIAVVWLYAQSFRIDNTTAHIYSSLGQIVKSIIYIMGSAFLLADGAELLKLALRKGGTLQTDSISFRHPFLMPIGVILMCWLPYLIIAFPGYTCVDSWVQLMHYYGLRQFTAHHPPLHTVLMGVFVNFGVGVFGNGESGIYLFILFQTVILLAAMGYTLYALQILKMPKWLYIGTICFFVLCPYFLAYTATLLKDNLFSSFFMLFMVEYLFVLRQKGFSGIGDLFRQKPSHFLIFFVSVFGVLAFRNNGKYVIYPLLLIFLICLLKEAIHEKRVLKSLSSFCLLLVPVLFAAAGSFTVNSYFNVQPGSIREALSLPFQQTARYVRDHGDEVTAEEKESISVVLNYDVLAGKYNPRIADEVKNTYNNSASLQDLISYFKTWLTQFTKHPMTYFDATMNQNYYILYPMMDNDNMYDSVYLETNTTVTKAIEDLGFFGTPDEVVMGEAKTVFTKVERMLFSLPVIGLLSSLGFHNLILAAMIILMSRNKRSHFLLYCLPLILSDLIIILAPVIYGHPRYGFPIIYSMPMVIAMYIMLQRSDKNMIEPVIVKTKEEVFFHG